MYREYTNCIYYSINTKVLLRGVKFTQAYEINKTRYCIALEKTVCTPDFAQKRQLSRLKLLNETN